MASAPEGLLDERSKPCLLEMMVGGQRVFDSTLFHHDERGAIGERPFLVGPLRVEFAGLPEQVAAGRDNLHVRLAAKQFQKAGEAWAAFETAQAVPDFRQDELGGEKRTGRL